MDNMNQLVAATLSGQELQQIMDLEKSINQNHKGTKEIYILAFEKK